MKPIPFRALLVSVAVCLLQQSFPSWPAAVAQTESGSRDQDHSNHDVDDHAGASSAPGNGDPERSEVDVGVEEPIVDCNATPDVDGAAVRAAAQASHFDPRQPWNQNSPPPARCHETIRDSRPLLRYWLLRFDRWRRRPPTGGGLFRGHQDGWRVFADYLAESITIDHPSRDGLDRLRGHLLGLSVLEQCEFSGLPNDEDDAATIESVRSTAGLPREFIRQCERYLEDAQRSAREFAAHSNALRMASITRHPIGDFHLGTTPAVARRSCRHAGGTLERANVCSLSTVGYTWETRAGRVCRLSTVVASNSLNDYRRLLLDARNAFGAPRHTSPSEARWEAGPDVGAKVVVMDVQAATGRVARHRYLASLMIWSHRRCAL